MATLKESPSQTAGPFVHIGCVPQSAGLAQRHMGSQLGTRSGKRGPRANMLTPTGSPIGGDKTLILTLALPVSLHSSRVSSSQQIQMALAGERSSSLIAEKTAQGYRHTIYLQGPNETVFFDV